MKTKPLGKDFLMQQIEELKRIPTIPAILTPLLNYLQTPAEQLSMQKLTELLAQDESLAAQCLHLANSPLFARWQRVESLRGAVISLGFHHVRDIALSCCVLNMLPQRKGPNPVVFWEHSLGCAVVCRRLSREIQLGDPGKAYLAGLFHDLGIVVNLWIAPQEFEQAFLLAKAESIPLHEAEGKVLGFTHCDSGRLLGQNWKLPADLIEVMAHHHALRDSAPNPELPALVHIADLLCRMGGLDHGYVEQRQVSLFDDPGFALLARSATLHHYDWARLTFELDSYLDEVHSLVHAIYRT